VCIAEDNTGGAREIARLRDENEQLRTAIETALEENARIVEDRDNLHRRVAMLGRELRVASLATARTQEDDDAQQAQSLKTEQQNQAEEELRVAFEELQVLAEELEVANNALHQNNLELENRVLERTGELAAANASLTAAEIALRAIADLVPDLLWRADNWGAAGWYNRRWYEYTGQTLEHSLGAGWSSAVHPDDREGSLLAWQHTIATGTPFEREHRLRRHTGEYRWFLVRADAQRDEHGRTLQWFGSVTDIHDQRAAMAALEQSELRFRSLVEGMPQLVWRAVDGGKWTWSSPQWESYTGLSSEQSRGMGWLDAVHLNDRAEVVAAWERAAAGDHLDFECRMVHAQEGRHRHFRTRATAVRKTDGGEPEWIGTSTDVDDLLQLQAQQAVLVSELQHRTRNLMAVVQSITLRTLKGSVDFDSFRESIVDRLGALGRVQGLLSNRQYAMRVTFDALIRDEISAHVALDEAGHAPQVALSGPAGVELRSSTVQTFALAMHELATNAVKYGALSQPDAQLEVTWRVEHTDESSPLLHVSWRERGVKGVPKQGAAPIGSGLGRELIERALPFQLGARTEFRFAEDGVHCLIEMPVPDQRIAQEKDNG
jgi:two-component system CheB/CheR fusion protein